MRNATCADMAGVSQKIYFAGSIRGGREDAQLYARIITVLKKYGTVLTEHVGDVNLSKSGSEPAGERHLTEKEIHDRDIEWLEQSNVLVAEVTQPSLGVGYEIGRAVSMKKRILCLFRPESGRRLSAMVRGSDAVVVKDYTEDEMPSILEDYFSKS